jgi:hypothetical protein
MSDVYDRLAALDPAAGDPYRARNLDDMISRVIASSPSSAARSTWWQKVQLRIAGTLILGTLVGAGTVAIVAGGPSFAPLAIQAHVAPHPGAFAAENAVQLYEETSFAPSASLQSSSSSLPSAIPSFKLSVPKDIVGETAHLASVFRVTGPVRHHGDDWTVKSPSGASFDYQTSSAAPQWYYSSTTPKVAPATASSFVDVVMPSHATLDRDVHGSLARLGFNYSVTRPVYSESTVSSIDAKGAPRSQSQEGVMYEVSVGGVLTDQTVNFVVDPHNTLVYAQGPAFDVSAGTDYPLQSVVAGVNTLNSIERTDAASPAVGASAARPGIVRAKITSASISLATFRLKDGTSWLLPLYTYSGRATKNGHGATAATWSEIAVEPSYVQLSSGEARSLLNH